MQSFKYIASLSILLNLMFSKTLRDQLGCFLGRTFWKSLFVSNVRNGRICLCAKDIFKKYSKTRDMKLFLSWRYNTPPLTRKPLIEKRGLNKGKTKYIQIYKALIRGKMNSLMGKMPVFSRLQDCY